MLITYNSLSNDINKGRKELKNILASLTSFKQFGIFFTLPNHDLDANFIKKEIIKYANTFSKEIYGATVSFSNIWCNINYYKDFNSLHDHNDEMISGVYYTQTPKDCGNIFFFNPAWQINRYPKLNNYSAQSWWLPSKEGTLYLFPSWLLHNVEPNLNKKKKRISFSFNLI